MRASEPMESALAGIGSMTEALERSMKLAGIAPKEMAHRLGIGYDHFTRMFREHDGRHFPPDLIPRFMEEAGNTLPLEWLAWRMGYAIHSHSVSAVLVAIRDAMTEDGKKPNFAICRNNRVEAA